VNVQITIKNGEIIGSYPKGLNPHEALTLVVKFPENYFQIDQSKLQKLNHQQLIQNKDSLIIGKIKEKKRGDAGILFLKEYSKTGTLAIPIVIFLFFLWIIGFPKKRQRKIIPQYTAPKGLTPTEAGLLLDNKIQNHDVLSLFYYRATNGYLKIEVKEKKILLFKKKIYTLTPLKKLPFTAKEFERNFWKDLFGTNLSTFEL